MARRNKIHSKIHELARLIKKEGILGFSYATFKATKDIHGNIRLPNYTVGQYCIQEGLRCGVTGENYATELLQIMQQVAGGNYREFDGECSQCWSFTYKGEEHICFE